MTDPKGARHCPRCKHSIKRADLVVSNAGESFHHRCFVQNGGAYDPIHEFLRRHYPSAVCVYCLSRMFELTHDQARKLVRASRSGRRLVILLGARCAGCRGSRLTVQAVAYDETQQTLASRSRGRRRRPARAD